MTEEYYCLKCDRFVRIIPGEFTHPHLGIRPCFVCAKCQKFMVYLKKLEDRVC